MQKRIYTKKYFYLSYIIIFYNKTNVFLSVFLKKKCEGKISVRKIR